MVIQCDQCQARFKLDDEKLQRGPVKVRCSKCKHVFLVSSQDSAAAALDSAAVASSGGAAGNAEKSSAPPPQAAPDWSDLTAGSATESTTDQAKDSGTGGFDFNEFDFSDGSSVAGATSAAIPQQAPSLPVEERFEISGFGDLEPSAISASAPPMTNAEKSITDALDFGDLTFSDTPPIPEPKADDTAAAADFSFDFGDLGLSDDASDRGAPAQAQHQETAFTSSAETQDGSFSLDFKPEPPAAGTSSSDASLDFSFDIDNLAPATPSQATAAGAGEAGGLDFGEIDFGDIVDTPTSPSQSAATKPAVALNEETVFAGDQSPTASAMPFAAEAADELPPLAIPSRRKSRSLVPVLVVTAAVVVIVALAGFGFYVLSGPEAFTKLGLGFVADMAGVKVQEEGVIAIRNVTGTFVQSKEAGELLVVRGEAVNNFKKPRASIQVKAFLYDKAGGVLANMTAYCGNDIAKDQLAVLPMAKINEAMNNQFGDSLANLGVQPGKAIPFVVVFSAIPKEAADFAVQVAGSTVATQ
ncbi:MAG TPA: DUF3426 domain-containing protein [Geobacteraceae bacterium]